MIFPMVLVDPIAISFFATLIIWVSYYYGRHTIMKIIEETVIEHQEIALEKAIDTCLDKLIDDGYLIAEMNDDGEIDLIKLEEVIDKSILAKYSLDNID